MSAVLGSMSWMRLAHSTPLMPGISTSMKTISGRSSANSSRQASPLSASPTRRKPSAFSMSLRNTSRMPGWSSQTITFSSLMPSRPFCG